MTPQELYKAGELDQAIKALGEELRGNPLDAKRRTFLFELLSFAGEWDRAEKHLDVLANQSPKDAPGMLLYRSALHAERTRQEMFRNKEFPSRESKDAPPSGTWNDQPFERLADADSTIGDHLEVFIAGSYVWVPTKYIERLEIDAPKDLRDLIWISGRIQVSPAFRMQELGEVLLPVIAPLSYMHSDNNVRLGRTSVWEEKDGEETLYGQKLIYVDGEEIPLLEFRSIVWNPAGEAQPEPVDAAS